MKKLSQQIIDVHLFCSILILLSVFILSTSCQAEVNLGDEVSKLKKETPHLSLGVGLFGNPILSGVVKDGLGYPKGELYASVANFGGKIHPYSAAYTWVFGFPTEADIEKAMREVKEEYRKIEIQTNELSRLIRRKMSNRINYAALEVYNFGFLGLVPSLRFGWMWLLEDNFRFRLGFGFPLAINGEINFDFYEFKRR